MELFKGVWSRKRRGTASIVRPLAYASFYAKLQEERTTGRYGRNISCAAGFLTDSCLFWICRFCDPDAEKERLLEKYRSAPQPDLAGRLRIIDEMGKRYGGDATIFEWGCYLFFRTDFWHFQKGHEAERRIIAPLLEKKFLDYFGRAFGNVAANGAFNNRLDLLYEACEGRR